jgi:exonuclease III
MGFSREAGLAWLALGQAFCRVNHHLAIPGLASEARADSICTAQRSSDHAPLVIEPDFKL